MIWCTKTYTIAYVKIQKKKWWYTIHYVKPTAQLLFKSRFPKGGPTCRRQVVDPRHQTPQGSVGKPETPPAEYPSWVARCDIRGSDGTMLNPTFWKKVQGQKHHGRWEIAERQIASPFCPGGDGLNQTPRRSCDVTVININIILICHKHLPKLSVTPPTWPVGRPVMTVSPGTTSVTTISTALIGRMKNPAN